ncbi:MAG: DUF2059 domain-containing protein [Nitrososphaera sp.]|nr:DUF2059 domain-containing protein [Nitrososphaera sp.]
MKKAFILALMIAAFPTWSYAQDTIGNRLAAAERYADTFDFQAMLDDTFRQMAANLPANDRNKLLQATQNVDWSWMRNLAITSMIQVFSAEELDALANFYGSDIGRSILGKFPKYMATFQPAMQQRVIKEAKELLSNP